MLQHQILEDSIVAITIVCIFGAIFSVTHAYQTDTRNNTVVYVTEHPKHIVSEQQTNADNLIPLTQSDSNIITMEEETLSEEGVAETVITERKPIVTIEEEVLTPVFKKPVISPLQPDTRSEYTQKLTTLIEIQTNEFRLKNELQRLQEDTRLKQSATQYSKTMLENNFLSHTNIDGCDLTCRFQQSGYEAWSWGENLAMYEFSSLPPVEEVATFFMTEWKKSSGHKDNLLSSKFTHQGVGISVSNHAIYASVQFAKPTE